MSNIAHTEDSNFNLTLSVTNNSTIEFKRMGGWNSSSGHITTVNDIPAGQTQPIALSGVGTSGTWTGLVGHASWQASLPNRDKANVTLNFDMPYSGSNGASFSGDATFNKYFHIDPNIVMPGGGENARLGATINPRKTN